jgi:hypothetical protein
MVIKTLQQLKTQEKGLLDTHQSHFIEYGRAYRDIHEMCNDWGGHKLSEEVLISDMAYKYVEHEKRLFDLTKKEEHKLHIKAASELYKKNYVTYNKIHELLIKFNRLLEFSEAKDYLSKNYPAIYVNTMPETLERVLTDLNGREYETNTN